MSTFRARFCATMRTIGAAAHRVCLRSGKVPGAISASFDTQQEAAEVFDTEEININGKVVVITPAYWKLTDIVLAVLQAAKAADQRATTAEIVKSVFLADCEQLKRLGRPISFDIYKAMRRWPVGSAVYDLLLADPDDAIVAKTHGIKWKRVWRPDIANGTYEFFDPSEEPDTESIIARSDVRALREALAEVKRLGFFGVSDKTHDHKAYKAVWREDPTRKAFKMRYEDLLEVPDPEVLRNIAELSIAGRPQ